MHLSKSNIKLIAGLGNPGKEYEGTRHNAGFEALDKLLAILPGSFKRFEGFSSIYWKGRFKGQTLFIQKPMTYMNLSGKAVSAIMRRNNITPEELLLIYDDVDLPPGRLRIKKDGGSAGHNGAESVIQEIGSSKFARLRIGIGRSSENGQIDHVLSEFSGDEKKLLDKVCARSAEAAKLILCRGVTDAMNEFNGELVEL